ncbi:Uncharacterized protein Rs2_44564 [Raphanus sativus]|nr:Uncharacterized protein Rs2_47006 [Raphanus sativus]KAJ4873709.1 Uncharacterized protein Rs2_44564 [Raphanus sativus]
MPLFPPPSEAALLPSMAMMVTTSPSCLRPPPDRPPSSCLNAPLETLSPVIPPEPPDPPDNPLLHVAAVQLLACSSSRTVCSSFTPSHHWLCSYSAGNPSTSSVSQNVTRMNFRSVRSDDFDLHLQTLSTKNTQFEHQASSLNLVTRALSIVVQSMDVEVRYWVEESIDFKVVPFLYATKSES